MNPWLTLANLDQPPAPYVKVKPVKPVPARKINIDLRNRLQEQVAVIEARLKAVENAAKHYEGKPCETCGKTRRTTTSNRCGACKKLANLKLKSRAY